jgi:RNA polymerase sigma factor (sigma-70 family)
VLPTTTSALLASLLDEDSDRTDGAWAQFDQRSRPVLQSFGSSLGLVGEDARELAQDVLVSFVEEYRAGRYDRERGRLRSWLFSIARARVTRMQQARGRAAGARGDSVLVGLPEEDHMADVWEDEWRRALLQEGLKQLRASSRLEEKTLTVFESVVLEHRSPEDVASEMGVPTSTVYTAKFRAMERLREILTRLEGDWW